MPWTAVTTALMGLLVAISAYAGWKAWRTSTGWSRRALALGMLGLALVNAVALVAGWRLEVARGGSMLPSLERFSVLWVHQRAAIEKDLKPGDIVVFDSTWGEDGQGMPLAKRLVGRPGDHVVYRQGELWVNGHPVVNTWDSASLATFRLPGPLWKGQARLGAKPFQVLSDRGRRDHAWVDIVVPAGHCFVMGDNWGNSLDSRDMGVVDLGRIRGTVLSSWGGAEWMHP